MKKTNQKVANLSRITIILLLPLTILLTTLQFYAFNKDFYLKEFSKYQIPHVTGMSMEDLERATVRIIDYLKDEEKDLVIEGIVKGQHREIFGERAKLHMVDVKNLFLGGFLLRNMSILLIAVSLFLLIKFTSDYRIHLYRSLFHSSILTFALMGILLLLMQIDFYKYFTHFHEIFFDNDLWLLDPNTEVLIQMLPLEFFIDISTRVVGWFMGIMSVIGGISYFRLKKLQRKNM